MSRGITARFQADAARAARQGPHWSASALVFTILAFFIAFVIWSANAPLDQVTRGEGRVIPSGNVQVVESLEGGIIKRILVSEGDTVERGQLLLRLDPTTAEAAFRGDRAEYLGLLATKARLNAEIEGRGSVSFPEEVLQEAPYLIASEQALFRGRRAEYQSSIAILRDQAQQKRQELREQETKLISLERRMDLVNEELLITEPNVAAGITSRVEMLRLQRTMAEVEGDMNSSRESIPRIRSSISEAERRIQERRNAFRADSLNQRNAIQVRLASMEERLRDPEIRLTRTEVRAPVAGVVKTLEVNTIGEVAQPGAPLVEIVPIDETLLVEARIKPDDIAFLYPGQNAKVKLTAYDFLVYGSIDAELERIGADSKIDDRGQTYYEIQVRTIENTLEKDGEQLPILPGMVAQVDILTGKKTVLTYLMKPFLRGQQAFQER